MKKYQVITVGAATRDVILRSRAIQVLKDEHFSTGQGECITLGSKIEVEDIVFETGGGATNTAVGFSRQGYVTAFLGRIGATDTRGQVIIKELKLEKVRTELVSTDRREMTAYSVVLLTAGGERTVLVYRGASNNFSSGDIKWKNFDADWLYITALGGKIEFLRRIWRQANRKNMRIMWNPGQTEIVLGLKRLSPLIKGTDILMLNQEEATELYGLNRFQYQIAFERLRQISGGLVVITLGADGSLAGNRHAAWRGGTNPIKVVDTTGAGDAFGCGFLGSYIRTGGKIPAALQMGTANSESVIQYMGAKRGLLTGQRRLHPVRVENI